jgi:hypothetical protein
LLVASVAQAATIVYEQLPGPGSGGAYNSSTLDGAGVPPGFTTADDFLVPSGATITDVHWWGESVSGGDDFVFTFYADGGGLPGAVLHTTGGTLAKVVDNPGSSLDPVFFYSSDLTTSFLAAAGTTYWISIFNQAGDAAWNWLVADDAGNGGRQDTNPGPPWDRPTSNLAFQLTAVPEPAALTLLGAGLAYVAARRRTRA